MPDIQKVQEQISTTETLTHSSEINKIIPSLARAKRQFAVAIKSSENPFYRSKYADLAAIERAIGPALAENGLFLMQPVNPHGHNSEVSVTIETILWHESGQFLSSSADVPYMTARSGKGELDVHGMGSMLTYFRRYLKLAFLDIVTDDDDGNAAMPQQPVQHKKVQYQTKPEQMQGEYDGVHALYESASQAADKIIRVDKPSPQEIQQLESDFERLDEESQTAFSDWLKKHNASSISELTNRHFKAARLAVDRKLNDAEINRKAAIKQLLAKADKAKIHRDFLSKLAAEWFNDTPLNELSESDVSWFLENWDAQVQLNWSECKPISKKQAKDLRQACEQAGLFESVLIQNISRQMMIAKLDDLPVSLYQQVFDSIPQIVEKQAIEYQAAKG